MKAHTTKDFYAGLLFAGVGLAAVIGGQAYPMGTATRMGPAYVPTIVGSLLVLLGLVIVGRALRNGGARLESFALRPVVFLLAAVIAFGLLIQSFGLVCALFGLLVLGCLAAPRPRVADMIILFLVLTLLANGLFVHLLGLPLKVWPI